MSNIADLKGDYSPMELTIFDTLRKQSPATTKHLLRKVYPRKQAEPFNASIIINRAVVTLGMKLERNSEPFRLKRDKPPRQRLIENRLVRA